MQASRPEKNRLDYKEPLDALFATKKLIETDRQTDRPTDRPTNIAISRAPMELKRSNSIKKVSVSKSVTDCEPYVLVFAKCDGNWSYFLIQCSVAKK